MNKDTKVPPKNRSFTPTIKLKVMKIWHDMIENIVPREILVMRLQKAVDEMDKELQLNKELEDFPPLLAPRRKKT
jgi:hypothetical protein